MAKNYKVLIVEDKPEYYEPLRECLNGSDDFEVLAVTGSATKAFELIFSGLPDAIIVDLQLSEGDGIQLLQKLYETKDKLSIKPYIIAVTISESDRNERRINKGLADFFYSKNNKDYGPELLLGLLESMVPEFDRNTNPETHKVMSPREKEMHLRLRVERELDRYFIKHGIAAKKYLIDALCLVIGKSDEPKPVLHKLFTEIGKKYGKSWRSVDVGISTLIQHAFEKTDEDDLRNNFPAYIDIDRGNPSNGEFIFYTAEKIMKEQEIQDFNHLQGALKI